MPQSQPKKAVLIGLGMVADTHLQAMANLKEQVQLHGIYSRNQRSVLNFSGKVQRLCGYSAHCYESLESITADPAVDFAIVITPPDARYAIVDKLSAAGIAILLEKPIERDSRAATDIVDLCEQRGVTLGVVFQHRARAASVKLQEFISADRFGELAMVQVAVPWWRDQSYYDEPGRGTYARDGGGVLITQAIHTLDLMLSLTGKVVEVHALSNTTKLHDMESEDFVAAGLVFANGAVGSLMATTASFPGAPESISLHFSNAVANLQRGVLSIHWRDGRTEEFGASADTGGGVDPMAFTSDWHRDVIADFASIHNSGKRPMVTGREALRVHYLIDALVNSSKERRAIKVKSLD